VITTIAGNGAYGYSGDGGPATQAEFYDPWAVAVDRAGNLYVADAILNRIRKVSPGGMVTTVAGGSTAGFSGDGGPATSAQLNAPTALAVDSAGDLFIAEGVNHRIRKVTPDGIITTVAGTGVLGSAGEGGPAISAQLSDPVGVAVDSAGNLYIVDQADGGRLSKVSTQGVLTALTAPGDIGGPAKGSQSTFPNAVAVDSAGNIYVTDTYHFRVRMIPAGGTIVTIAGNGTSGYSGEYWARRRRPS
jgi:DNA-binding beta-propeller fold protein YncE